MDTATRRALTQAEATALAEALGSALNNLEGPHGVRWRAVARDLYYAAFHLATALLAAHGLQARSHEATQQMLATHFVRGGTLPADTARRYNRLMERRHTADYKTTVPLDADDILEFRDWLCDFVEAGLALLGTTLARPVRAEVAALVDALRSVRLDAPAKAGRKARAPRG
jgi:uncharacterized protein (UPF0332 family)